MKNIAINSLKYTGIVTLSQYSGNKKLTIATLHNEGGDALFDFLASCLVGDFARARVYRPTKVMLIERKSDSGGNFVYSSPSGGGGMNYILATPEKVYSAGICKVRYSFIISKDDLEGITNFDDLYLGLYPDKADENEPENFAALCKLAITRTDIANAVLAVDWELIISNMAKS